MPPPINKRQGTYKPGSLLHVYGSLFAYCLCVTPALLGCSSQAPPKSMLLTDTALSSIRLDKETGSAFFKFQGTIANVYRDLRRKSLPPRKLSFSLGGKSYSLQQKEGLPLPILYEKLNKGFKELLDLNSLALSKPNITFEAFRINLKGSYIAVELSDKHTNSQQLYIKDINNQKWIKATDNAYEFEWGDGGNALYWSEISPDRRAGRIMKLSLPTFTRKAIYLESDPLRSLRISPDKQERFIFIASENLSTRVLS
ncbi:MAG: hypothetical protein D6808_06975, partial [Candidatus Dadabacteria bacterium]